MTGVATASPPSDSELDDDGGELDAAARRRFTIATLIGAGIALIPFVWVLWDGKLDPLRTAWVNGARSEFYDLQARALLEGHWHVPKGSLGLEAVVIER